MAEVENKVEDIVSVNADEAANPLNAGSRSVDVRVEEIVSVNADEAANLLHSGSRYLDVRMEEDFLKGHVEGALNIPYYSSVTAEEKVKNPEFLNKVSAVFGHDDTFIVGCMTGNRSRLATADILHAGFLNVKNMKNGYKSWVEKKAAESTSAVRGSEYDLAPRQQ
ncbi:thiosulfate sulfurtransferase 18-like [Wolffia australiana]